MPFATGLVARLPRCRRLDHEEGQGDCAILGNLA
jgi:hypothetical protein